MMKRKTILILGTSTMQLPAIRAANRLGWQVVLADRNRDGEGYAMADRFIHVDLADREGMLIAAREVHEDIGLDGVFTAGTDFSATVAHVAEGLALPGIPLSVALDASDKFRMRSVFSSAGLPSPDFTVVGPGEDAAAASEHLGMPLVVKPVDNMGARGVKRVDSHHELKFAVSDALGYSRSSRAIVEQFIDGPEFSLDALVCHGEITLCGVADRHIRFPPYFVEVGHTMPSNQASSVVDAVVDLFFRGIKALGIENGAAKGDIKYGDDGPVIGEIAARLSGGYMSGWTYPYSSGVDVTEAALKIAVGEDPGDLPTSRNYTSAERAFYSIPGIIDEVLGMPARPVSPVEEAFLRVSPGDTVVFPRNNVDKCGNFIAVAPERSVAIRAAEEACNAVLIRLRPGEARTEKFLFDDDEAWIPDAFASDDETRRVISRLPVQGDGDASSESDYGILPLSTRTPEEGYDWQGRSIAYSLRMIEKVTGVVESGGRVLLGRRFWQALFRGGVQGACWYIDSIRNGSIEE